MRVRVGKEKDMRNRGVPEPLQTCPECGQAIKFKVDPGESLKVINVDGTPHVCPTDEPVLIRKTAFGDALQGRTIEGFTLRDRRLMLTLDGSRTLEVYAVGNAPLKLQLTSPDGILRE